MKVKVTVVIPNWNGADYISRCIDSLLAQTTKHKIILVDNGSVDNSIEIIKNQYSEVKLIKLEKNHGFAGGVNEGIKYSIKNTYDYVALFNNDAIADKHWLEKLIQAADKHQEAGIITGKFMKIDKQHLDSTGDFYSTVGMPFPRGRNQIDKGQYDKPENVFSATGGASLYRISMIKEIGKFDEKFFAYFEDVDISFRAQLAGWKVWYEPNAIAYHHVGATSSKLGNFTRYHSIKNFYFLYIKNMPLRLMLKYSPRFIFQALKMFISSLVKGAGLVYIKAFGRVILEIPTILKERRLIQKYKKVSSDYIDNFLYKGKPPKIPL